MKSLKPRAGDLTSIYNERYSSTLLTVADELALYISELMKGVPRIDRIAVRAKTPESFLKKAAAEVDGKRKYVDPLSQIQDQIGARIITFYKSDVQHIDALVTKYFRPIEIKNRVPDSEWEFGYFGRHYVLVIPSDVKLDNIDEKAIPEFFELQIKTLFQHAWSEAEHDLGYKPAADQLGAEEKRKLAFTSAQAWGADQIFDELFRAHEQ